MIRCAFFSIKRNVYNFVILFDIFTLVIQYVCIYTHLRLSCLTLQYIKVPLNMFQPFAPLQYSIYFLWPVFVCFNLKDSTALSALPSRSYLLALTLTWCHIKMLGANTVTELLCRCYAPIALLPRSSSLALHPINFFIHCYQIGMTSINKLAFPLAYMQVPNMLSNVCLFYNKPSRNEPVVPSWCWLSLYSPFRFSIAVIALWSSWKHSEISVLCGNALVDVKTPPLCHFLKYVDYVWNFIVALLATTWYVQSHWEQGKRNYTQHIAFLCFIDQNWYGAHSI